MAAADTGSLITTKAMGTSPAFSSGLGSTAASTIAGCDSSTASSSAEKAGEVPIAFVVIKEPVSAAAIMDYVSERVASYKRIRRVEFVDQIPKSPAGKILRRVLAQRVRQEMRNTEEGTKSV